VSPADGKINVIFCRVVDSDSMTCVDPGPDPESGFMEKKNEEKKDTFDF
jgi:hypothetical protein